MANPNGSRLRRLLHPETIIAAIGWAALACFVIVSVVPGLLEDRVFASTNILMRSSMYWSVADAQSVTGNALVSDTVDSVLPTTLLFGDRLSQGDFAFRNPFQSGGSDLGGMPNGGFFSPLSWVYLIVPGAMAPAIVKILEIALVALGMSLFLRRLKITPAAWPLASLLFVSSGFMVAWTNWPQTRVAAFIPLLFWAVDRLIATRRWTSIPLVGIVLGSMWLGGFPAVVFYTLYLVTAYAIVRAFTLWRGNTRQGWLDIVWQALRYVGGIVSGVLVAAVHLVPFVLGSATMIDFGSRSGNRGSHIETVALSTALFPYSMGRPDFTLHWGSGHPVEQLSYIGIGGAALVVIALVLRHRIPIPNPVMWFFVLALLVLGTAVYWGGPVLALIQELPTMSSSLSGRLRSVIGFLVAVIAAFGLHALLRRDDRAIGTKWGGLILEIVCLAGAAAIVVALVLTSTDAILNSPAPAVAARWVQFTLIAAVIFAVIAVVLTKYPLPWFQVLAGFTIFAIVALPAAQTARQWWTINDASTYYPPTQATDYLAEHLDDQRYISFGNSIYIGVSSAYELRDFAGRGFTTTQWRELIGEVDPGAQRTVTFAEPTAEGMPEAIGSPILDRFGVHYAAMPSSLQLPGPVEDVTGQVVSTLVLSKDSAIETADVTGPTRGVVISAADVTDIPWDGIQIDVRAVAPDGTILAENEQELRQIDDSIFLALDGDEFAADQEWHLEVSTSTAAATVNLWADQGDAALNIVRPQEDGLNVVATGDVTIVAREDALDRVRWASDPVVIEDPAERLTYLDTDAGPNEVVLEHQSDVQQGGGVGEVVMHDSGDLDITTATVTTDGPGWVVFAESTRLDGWHATLNGEAADLVDAEHAGSAVYVPAAGTYELKIEYVTPGFYAGLAVTGLTLIAFALIGGWAVFAGRKRRQNVDASADSSSTAAE